jgi:ATP-dependent helicase IRC3
MGKLSASGFADITVASLQSITSQDRLLKFDPARFKLVLVDEAHHIVSPGYLKILRHLGLASKQPDSPHLVGVSATFSRFDGVSLGAAIDEIVYHKDYIDMIGEKWLSDVVFTTVESTADLRRIERTGPGGTGEFETAALSRAVNTNEINDITVRSWLARAAGRKSTLVFCVDLNHVASLTQRFRHSGIDARFITGDTPARERSERLDDFKKGVFPVLVNCGVFTEGTDIPNIDCLVMARPTRSRNLLVQMIGRGMRLHPGKKDCHVIDMVSSLATGIITTPTLFGLDPNELVSAASPEEMQDMRDRKEAEKERAEKVERPITDPGSATRPRNVTFTHYDSVFDLIADGSGERHIRAISQFSWVQVGPNRYVLNSLDKSFIKIEKVQDTFKGFEVRSLPTGVSASPFAAPKELLSATTLEAAVHGCDKYAKEKYPFNFISRRAGWRNGPATDTQIKFLNKLRSEDDQLQPGDINRGKATDMITKVRHGAKGWFANTEADKKRRAKANLFMEQERAQRLREKISIGPVLT